MINTSALAGAAGFLPQNPGPRDKAQPAREPFGDGWTYIKGCLDADILTPACQPFWAWVIGALLVIAVIVLAWLAVKFISHRMKLEAALRAEAERAKIADEETMRAHAWDGDKAYQTDVPAEDVERRIKDALVSRANPGRPPGV